MEGTPTGAGRTGRPPSLSIVLELEAPPRVYLDCANGAEEERLRDWINASEALCDLVIDALELEGAAA